MTELIEFAIAVAATGLFWAGFFNAEASGWLADRLPCAATRSLERFCWNNTTRISKGSLLLLMLGTLIISFVRGETYS